MLPEDRQEYHRRYLEQKEMGKPFFPYTVVKDVVAALIVFGILLALMVLAEVPLESRADPTNASYVPRPEWYFLFLFESLKYFPGELEFVGVVGTPGLAVLALLLLPWLDRGWVRHPRHRPMTMLVAALALVAMAGLTFRAYQTTPSAGASLAPPLSVAEQAGKQLYQAQNCEACHSLGGVGSRTGPDLAGLGQRRSLTEITQYIANPKAVNPVSAMPGYVPPLTLEQAGQIAQYLAMAK